MHNDPSIVFVVDDDASVRTSLDLLIRGAGWQTEVFASAAEFMQRPAHPGVCCLVLDVLGSGLNGLDMQGLLADRANMPIVLVSGRSDVVASLCGIRKGAIELLAANDLLNAISYGVERSHAAQGAAKELQTLNTSFASLTPREREVMALVVAGLLNKQVGARLGISEITVKAHRGSVMRKMRATSFAELVMMAVRLRIVDASHTAASNLPTVGGHEQVFQSTQLARADHNRRAAAIA